MSVDSFFGSLAFVVFCCLTVLFVVFTACASDTLFIAHHWDFYR